MIFKKLFFRYKQFSALKQLCILFGINWICWFIFSIIGDRFFYEERHSMGYHLFDATFMALCWTLFWNYTALKLLFSPKRKKI